MQHLRTFSLYCEVETHIVLKAKDPNNPPKNGSEKVQYLYGRYKSGVKKEIKRKSHFSLFFIRGQKKRTKKLLSFSKVVKE